MKAFSVLTALIALVLVVCCAERAMSASIQIDAFDDSGELDSGSSTTGTISGFTVANNDNRLLVVTVAGELDEPDDRVTGITFGAQSFTEAVTAPDPGGPSFASVWYLVNPSATTADIDVTLAGSLNGWTFGALSVFNAAQQGPIDTGSSSSGGSTSASASLNAVTDGILVDAMEGNNNVTLTAASGQTSFYQIADSDGGANLGGWTGAGAYRLTAVAGSTSEAWTLGASERNAFATASFAPFSVPEPSAAVLGWLALGALATLGWRRNRSREDNNQNELGFSITRTERKVPVMASNRQFGLLAFIVAVAGLIMASGANAATITSVTNNNSLDGGDVYLIGSLAEDVDSFIDRTHEYNGVTAAGIPSFLLGADYVLTANDDKTATAAAPTFSIDMTLGAPARVYLFIDNRVGDGSGGDPPSLGGGDMDWVLAAGYTDTGLDIGIDEGGGGVGPGASIDAPSSIFVSQGVINPSTITFFEQDDGGSRNMYGIAAVAVPEPSSAALGLLALAGLATISWGRKRVRKYE